MIESFAMRHAFRSSLSRGRRTVEKSIVAFGFLLVSTAISAQASDYEKAHQLVVQQKWTEALPLLKALHEEAPASMMVGVDLAQTLIRLNRREEAITLLKRYGMTKQAQVAARSFITQESYKLYQEGLNLLESKKYGPSCDRFEKSLEKDQAHLDIQIRLIQCETLDGNIDAALRFVDSVERMYGEQPESTLWKGKALSMKGQTERAVAAFEKAVKMLPTSELAPVWLAETLYANGQKASAFSTLEADLKKNPQHVQSLITLARLKFSQSQNLAQFQEVQKDLQIAQSRMEKYASPKLRRFESELGVELRDAELTSKAIQLLSERLQERIKQPAS